MARRVVSEPCNVPVNFRVTETMKTKLDAAADAEKISSTEWVRQAIQEKLDRKERSISDITDAELDLRIEAVLKRLIKERDREKSEKT